MTWDALGMVFRRARVRSCVERLHPYLLRNTYGTRSAQKGITTLTLQRFKGPLAAERDRALQPHSDARLLGRERSYNHLDGLDQKVRRRVVDEGV